MGAECTFLMCSPTRRCGTVLQGCCVCSLATPSGGCSAWHQKQARNAVQERQEHQEHPCMMT